MRLLNYEQNTTEKVVVALGFFDCVHIGHQKLLTEAAKLAKTTNAKLAVFTFKNNPADILGFDTKPIYTFDERLTLFEKIGVDIVFAAEFSYAFKNISANEFIKSFKSAVGFVAGFDYTFGKGNEGNTTFLKDFCDNNKIECKIVSQVEYDNKKASSTLIKSYLKSGDIVNANKCLNNDYCISGVVTEGYKIGRTLNFPTINFNLENTRTYIKNGVYGGYVFINDKKYNAIINIGNRPTFNDNKLKLEAHILNFEGDLYNKQLTIYFSFFIREIEKFENSAQLKEQLKKDREVFND